MHSLQSLVIPVLLSDCLVLPSAYDKEYVSSYVWLITLNMIFSVSNHSTANDRILFFCMT